MEPGNAKRPDRGTIRPFAAAHVTQRGYKGPLGEVERAEPSRFGAFCPVPAHHISLMPRPRNKGNVERDAVIRQLRRQGLKHAVIATRVGLTGARVSQILRDPGRDSEAPSRPIHPETPVSELLELGTRVLRCLDRQGIVTVGQLAAIPPGVMLEWPSFGKTSLNRVQRVLRIARLVKKTLGLSAMIGCALATFFYDGVMKLFLEI